MSSDAFVAATTYAHCFWHSRVAVVKCWGGSRVCRQQSDVLMSSRLSSSPACTRDSRAKCWARLLVACTHGCTHVHAHVHWWGGLDADNLAWQAFFRSRGKTLFFAAFFLFYDTLVFVWCPLPGLRFARYGDTCDWTTHPWLTN